MLTKKKIDLFCGKNRLKDSIICVHSSFKSFGSVENGPGTIIEGFINNQITLLCPTFYYDGVINPDEYTYKRNGIDYNRYKFDKSIGFTDSVEQIDESMGIIPKSILQYPESIRSKNPLCSFASLGDYSKDLMENQNLLNVYSCYKNIMKSEKKSFIVLAGVDLTKCTPIHFCEELAGRKLFRRWAYYNNKKVEVEDGSCSDGFEKIHKKIKHIEKTDKLGNSKMRIYEFKEFVKTVTEIIKKYPGITHCCFDSCMRCNDMELGGRLEEKIYLNER